MVILLGVQTLPNQNQNLEFWSRNLRNPSLDIRINAIQKIQELKSSESAAALTESLSSPDAEVRAAAARALGKLPYDNALVALESKVGQETDSYVKAEINRSIRGLKQVFQKQEEKAAGKPAPTAPTESDELEDLE